MLLFAVPVFAAPQLKVEPPAKKVATGKSVFLKVQLEWPPSETYEFNSLEPKLENLTLTDQRQSQETGESISMVSEALSSGKRTIVFSPNGPYMAS